MLTIATHNSPRIWLLTTALSPLAVRLIKLLLAHGDYVAAGLPPTEIEDDDRSAEFRELINECKSGRKDREGWKDRIRGIRCDGRIMGQCGAAIAEAVEVFGRIDILLCCTSEGKILPTLLRNPVLRQSSSRWHSRRALHQYLNPKPRPRPIRNHLLQPSKLHQSHSPPAARTPQRPYHNPHRDWRPHRHARNAYVQRLNLGTGRLLRFSGLRNRAVQHQTHNRAAE